MFLHQKKIVFAIGMMVMLIFAQAFTVTDGSKKSGNLKVLPKDISEEELHRIMREYSKALGVKCGFCHAPAKGEEKGLDFASDAKHEKLVARKMMKMTAGINKKYFARDNKAHGMEHVTCVTCHMGSTHPEVSADSLKVYGPQKP